MWRSVNVALVASLMAFVYSSSWEYSVRRYLDGFDDAIIPANSTPEQRVDAILSWMREGPPRSTGEYPAGFSNRDPETTLNYQKLLSVCGTATNAFLNLAHNSGLEARRLLLLSPDRTTKHVVAEVLLHGQWIVVDPTYRIMMRNSKGEMLTRKDLQNPETFVEATKGVSYYPSTYTYESVAHVRLAKLPLDGFHLRPILDSIFPGWEEAADWSLLLERESFLALTISSLTTIFLLVSRFALAWYADRRLRIQRFRLRSHLNRARAAFFGTPEIK
jgi:hypothetical protein